MNLPQDMSWNVSPHAKRRLAELCLTLRAPAQDDDFGQRCAHLCGVVVRPTELGDLRDARRIGGEAEFRELWAAAFPRNLEAEKIAAIRASRQQTQAEREYRQRRMPAKMTSQGEDAESSISSPGITPCNTMSAPMRLVPAASLLSKDSWEMSARLQKHSARPPRTRNHKASE